MGVGADELWARPAHMLDSHGEHYAGELPAKFRLHLRLHNNDVHTFEEVIKALHAKSAEPIAVPVGGEGSVGGVGGAGVRGEDLRDAGDDGAAAPRPGGPGDDSARSLRNGRFPGDADVPPRQR